MHTPGRQPDPADPRTGPDGPARCYIPTLDGWRAVAILWVMLFHDGRQLFLPGGVMPSAPLYRFAQAGHLGVDIFFAISGFLICSRLIDERRRNGRIDLGGFYIRRCFRIMPPYYVFLAILGLLSLIGGGVVGGREYLSCLGFARNYLNTAGSPTEGLYTSHFWSLAVEEHFYLIWPGLLVLLATDRRAAWVALGLGILVRIWRTIDLRFAIAARYLGLPLTGYRQRTDVCLDGLFFGCLLALVVSNDRGRARLARLLNPWSWSALLAAFLAIIALEGKVPLSGQLIGALIPLLVVGTTLHPRSAAGRILEWTPARAVGRLSYSLYLWQPFLATIAIEPWPGGPGSAAPPARGLLGPLHAFPIGWIACFACALLSYHFIEKPTIALGRRLAARRRAAAAPPGSDARASEPAGGFAAGRRAR
ncbi:MAG TPA: acyltransferase [Isosphaeraceae bacterium]